MVLGFAGITIAVCVASPAVKEVVTVVFLSSLFCYAFFTLMVTGHTREMFRYHMTEAILGNPDSLAWLRVHANTKPKWMLGDDIYREAHLILAEYNELP